ncbi:putative acetyltransferase [Vigna angularis]|uniref:Putative acetyltransferase n=1 Tax=Phaseolus angularis TaxID=3914 RepID=A0A8T0K4T7_PHAAN|nr:putative acetyltransferase [Vigna angularis]
MPSSASAPTLLSKCTVFPDQPSTLGNLKLSVSDLPMLSCHYIQKGCLFTQPSIPLHTLIPLLKSALSRTLSLFPPLAGRLTTDSHGYVYIACNDAGVDFIHANAAALRVCDLLSPLDVHECFKEFFTFDRKVSYTGHYSPILAVQVTELADGLFIGCAVNHAVTDGTSFWNFFNTFAHLCRASSKSFRNIPDFHRDSALISDAVLRLPEGGPQVTFDSHAPLRERIFSFSREAIQKLKAMTNNRRWPENNGTAVELMRKQSNDQFHHAKENNGKAGTILENWFKVNSNSKPQTVTETVEISSFQSVCALLWRAVTRARKLPASKTTTFRMAVNCRHRMEPKLEPYYFGNAIQSVPTYASACDVLSRDLRWCAEQLNANVKAHDDAMVRRFIDDWEQKPRCRGRRWGGNLLATVGGVEVECMLVDTDAGVRVVGG